MKKSILIVLVLLLLLTACHAAPVSTETTADTTLSSGSVTQPSSSVAPPASSMPPTSSVPTTEPTTQPAVNPNLPPVPTDFDTNDGLVFIYDGPQSAVLMPTWTYSEGIIDHLYWVTKSTKECTLICDEPIYSRSYTRTDTHIFFVKESEPTKIYVVAKGDFLNHQVFYESTYGNVNDIVVLSSLGNYLQFVADEKEFFLLDMTTKETTLFMEQYYIESAAIGSARDGSGSIFEEYIVFFGKPTEDAPQGDYYYYWKTGEVITDNSL